MDGAKAFHRLRVTASNEDKAMTLDSANDSSATHILYNGISANMWLMPIGVVTRRHSIGSDSPVGGIHSECRSAVTKRALSASLMFGQHPCNGPCKQPWECPPRIDGVRMCRPDRKVIRGNINWEPQKLTASQIKPRPNIWFSDRAVPLYRKNKYERIRQELNTLQSMNTSSEQQPPIKEEPSKQFPESLLIRRIAKIQPQQVKRESEAEEMKPVTDDKFAEIFLNDANGGFTSTASMSAAYRSYVLNQPPGVETRHVNTPARSKLSSAASRRSRLGSSKASRTRSATPQKCLARNRFESSDPTQERPRSNWRPLIGSKDDVLHDSAGCTYRCRQCFSACLACEDYLRNIDEAPRKSQAHKPTKKSSQQKASPSQRWGIKAARKRLTTIVQDHPEVEHEQVVGLSIHFPSNAGSHAEQPNANVCQDNSQVEIPSELSTIKEDIKHKAKMRLQVNKNGTVRTIGHIAKAISNNNKNVKCTPNKLTVFGASLQEHDSDRLPKPKRRWNLLQVQTLKQAGNLAPLSIGDMDTRMGNLSIDGSMKPQHRRSESPLQGVLDADYTE